MTKLLGEAQLTFPIISNLDNLHNIKTEWGSCDIQIIHNRIILTYHKFPKILEIKAF